MKVGLLGMLESSSARADQIARQILAFGRPIPLDELVAKIDAVDGRGRPRGGPYAHRLGPADFRGSRAFKRA